MEKFLHHGSVEGSYTVEAWKILLIHCWVSSTIMIPRTREEKFLHRGSVERVLHRGSIEDYVDLLLGIKHHNNSQKKRGDVPTLWKCGKGLTP